MLNQDQQSKLMRYIQKHAYAVELKAMAPAVMRKYADDAGVSHNHVRAMIRRSKRLGDGMYDIRDCV